MAKTAVKQVWRHPETRLAFVYFADADTGAALNSLDGYSISEAGSNINAPAGTTQPAQQAAASAQEQPPVNTPLTASEARGGGEAFAPESRAERAAKAQEMMSRPGATVNGEGIVSVPTPSSGGFASYDPNTGWSAYTNKDGITTTFDAQGNILGGPGLAPQLGTKSGSSALFEDLKSIPVLGSVLNAVLSPIGGAITNVIDKIMGQTGTRNPDGTVTYQLGEDQPDGVIQNTSIEAPVNAGYITPASEQEVQNISTPVSNAPSGSGNFSFGNENVSGWETDGQGVYNNLDGTISGGRTTPTGVTSGGFLGGVSQSFSNNNNSNVAQGLDDPAVVDVILGEAIPPGWVGTEESLKDMMAIASVISNRASSLGVTPKSVVGLQSEFNAQKPAPGMQQYRDLALQAIQSVQKNGPTTTASFYATPAAQNNLPKGLVQVSQTKGHNYFEDPQGRAIFTKDGLKTPSQQNTNNQTNNPLMGIFNATAPTQSLATQRGMTGINEGNIAKRSIEARTEEEDNLSTLNSINSLPAGILSSPNNFYGQPIGVGATGSAVGNFGISAKNDFSSRSVTGNVSPTAEASGFATYSPTSFDITSAPISMPADNFLGLGGVTIDNRNPTAISNLGLSPNPVSVSTFTPQPASTAPQGFFGQEGGIPQQKDKSWQQSVVDMITPTIAPAVGWAIGKALENYGPQKEQTPLGSIADPRVSLTTQPSFVSSNPAQQGPVPYGMEESYLDYLAEKENESRSKLAPSITQDFTSNIDQGRSVFSNISDLAQASFATSQAEQAAERQAAQIAAQVAAQVAAERQAAQVAAQVAAERQAAQVAAQAAATYGGGGSGGSVSTAGPSGGFDSGIYSGPSGWESSGGGVWDSLGSGSAIDYGGGDNYGGGGWESSGGGVWDSLGSGSAIDYGGGDNYGGSSGVGTAGSSGRGSSTGSASSGAGTAGSASSSVGVSGAASGTGTVGGSSGGFNSAPGSTSGGYGGYGGWSGDGGWW